MFNIYSRAATSSTSFLYSSFPSQCCIWAAILSTKDLPLMGTSFHMVSGDNLNILFPSPHPTRILVDLSHRRFPEIRSLVCFLMDFGKPMGVFLKAMNIIFIILEIKQSCSLLRREWVSISKFPNCALYKHLWQDSSEESSICLAHKMCNNIRNPRRTVSQQ